MTQMISDPLDGSDTGVAPQSGPVRLLVEGWRFRPHSYALVNQYQLLEMLKRRDITVRHADYPLFTGLPDETTSGVMLPEEETALKMIPAPKPGEVFDAVYRIGYPYNFGPSSVPAFVFATCERMLVERDSWIGGTGTVGETVEQNNITIITPSEWSRRGFIKSGVSPDRVVVIPHGVDPLTFYPLPDKRREDDRKSLSCNDRFVFLNASAITGNKNVGGILEAFSKLVQKYPKALLVLKGLDSMYQSHKWLQVELDGMDNAFDRWKATKNLSYIGSTVSNKGLAHMMQTADCYVSPYKCEGFNIPVLEASACGLPVIVPEGGCTDDFVNDDFAIRIPSQIGDHDGDHRQWIRTKTEDIYSAMEKAILDRVVCARSLRAGPLNAQKYTWKSVTDRLMGVIAAVLKGKE